MVTVYEYKSVKTDFGRAGGDELAAHETNDGMFKPVS